MGQVGRKWGKRPVQIIW